MMVWLDKWQRRSRQHKLILLSCLAIFLPFYTTCIIDLILLMYALVKGELKQAYQQVRGAWCIIPFTLLSISVSLYYENYIGVLCSFCILLVFSMVIYFQCYGDQALLKSIMRMFVFMSILCGIYGLMEYCNILDTMGIDEFEILVMDSPKKRLNSVFFNANYYAMMIEFFVLMSMRLLIDEKEKSRMMYYAGVIGFNVFLLYLTGCRTAWPALAVGIFALVFDLKDKRWLLAFLGLGSLLLVVFSIEPTLFPRFGNIDEYFVNRVQIWKCAIENIKTHLFFGEGPLTYLHVYHYYPGARYTQHAHNIFIDPVLSYGLVGIAVIFPYFYARYQEIKHLTKRDYPKSLIVAFISCTLFHGLLDYTVYFVPTGLTFLMILGSGGWTAKKEA